VIAMTRVLLALAIATVVVVVGAPSARAQMAGALGKPLPSSDLETGAVSIRVVAGSPSSPVIGTEVTLSVNGATRVARTDNSGRAHFKDLPPGAQLQAKVAGEDGEDVTSEPFALPAQSGVRVMLSTRPWSTSAAAPAAPGGPAGAAGGPGMPSPRQMSGEPRPEQKDPPGTLTARLTYDDFAEAGPQDVDVALVGFHANDFIDMQVAKAGADGHAVFSKLDRTGSVSYFALTLLPRNDKYDRLISTPAVMDSRSGVRLVLSGDKKSSTAPPIDDLARFERQEPEVPRGKVRITVEGGVDPNQTVQLYEITSVAASTPDAIANARVMFAQAKPRPGPPDPTEIVASADFKERPDLPAHTAQVRVHGGINTTDAPLEGVEIMVATAETFAQRRGLVDARTGADGIGRVTVDPAQKGPFIATVTINGKSLTSKPFELAKSGGELEVEAHWRSEGKHQVEFDVTPRPGQVFFAQTSMHGQLFRSLPFQPVPDRGTHATIYVVPRVVFSFSLTSRVDDKYLAVNGRFDISNNSWAPYIGGPDGTLLPLPRGFVGGLVAEKDQHDIALVPGEGFRIVRPLPPGERKFHGAFSLPVDDGTVRWHLDLPYGSGNSGMEILQPPGMVVQTPPGVRGETVSVSQGTFFVLPQISILPRQAMVMTLTGLPQPPAWKYWMTRIVAGIVVVIILGGVTAALVRRRDTGAVVREQRRQRLLDELVELEQAARSGSGGKAAKRREQIMAELESLWSDEGEGTRPMA
jgi:hypothetical protein